MGNIAETYSGLFGLTEIVKNELSKDENFGALMPIEGIEKGLLKLEKESDGMRAISITEVLKSKCGRLAYVVLADNGIKGAMRITPGTLYAHPALGVPPFSFDCNEKQDFSLFFITDVNPLSQDETYLDKFVMSYFDAYHKKHSEILKKNSLEREPESWFEEIRSPVCLNYKWMYNEALDIDSVKKNVNITTIDYLTAWIKMVKEAKTIGDENVLQKLISKGDENMEKFRKNDMGFKVLRHYYGIVVAENYMKMLFPNLSHIKEISGELKL